jgi:HK97 family phage major capsid protein
MGKFKKLNADDLDLSCFDSEEQKDVVLSIVKSLQDVQEDVTDELRDVPAGERSLLAKDSRKLEKLTEVWKNNGRIDGLRERMSFDEMVNHDKKWRSDFISEAQDAGFTSTDHPLLINRVVSEVVKEAIEPNIVLTPLLQRINYTHGTQLTFPAVGAITAADIPEGGEYPERSLEFAGQVVATIGKSGVAVKMTDEMIRYSMFDVMSMHLRAAGRAMIRWKEQKVSDLITDNSGGANTLFDNTSTAYSSTTGRAADGAYNGTLTLDDLFKAYATMTNRGFTPNTIIMNPFAWEIFAQEAISKAFGWANGMAMWQTAQGGLGAAPQWSNGGFGNGLLQNTTVTSPQQVATTMTNVPNIFPVPFNIIVSPFMPVNTTSNRTDLIICDRAELGVLVVDEEIVTEEWDDPARDIRKVKLRERYGLGSVNNGEGSGLVKGVSINRGYDFANGLKPAEVTMPAGSPLTGDANNTQVV